MRSIGAMGLVGALVLGASTKAEAAPPGPSAPMHAIPLRAAGAALFVGDSAPIKTLAATPVGLRLPSAELRVGARDALARLPFSRAKTAELVVVSEDRFATGETVVRFEETYRGLPVVGSGASALLAPNGSLRSAMVDVASKVPASVLPALTPASAADVARKFVNLPVDGSDAQLVVFRTRGEARLAYAVVPRVPTGLPTAPRVIVDAVNGDVLSARDAVVFAKGRVYPTNPIKSPTLADLDFGIAPVGGKLSNDFITSMNCVDKKTVANLSFGGASFPIHVCDLVQTATPNGSGDFVATPQDAKGSLESKSDSFSEVSMYFHAARAYEFFRSLQGDPLAQVVEDKPLRTISNLQLPEGYGSFDLAKMKDPNLPLTPFQNAFFSPKGGGLGSIFSQLYGFDAGAMWFGQGPVRDYSYDGDVVYHEFTHAVVGHTLNLGFWHMDEYGAVDAPGAMNEGLADYFSSAITGDPSVGEYAVGDIQDGLKEIRTLDNTDKCPSAIAGEVHFDSTLFSGALWSVRSGLPEVDRKAFDGALYKAMRMSAGQGDLGYEDVATLFAAVIATDLPKASASFDAEMKTRGIFPSCARVLTYSGKPIASPFARFGFAAPGHSSLGVNSGTAPGLFQVKVALAAGKGRTMTVAATSIATGGGASALGGGGTPFAPVVLAKFDASIVWGAGLTNDAPVATPATAEGEAFSATVDVPDDATEAYVQIANSGDSDGNYDGLSIGVNGTEPEPTAGDDDDDDDDATKKSKKSSSGGGSDDSGCAVSTAHGGETGVFALGVVFALALATGARRRKA